MKAPSIAQLLSKNFGWNIKMHEHYPFFELRIILYPFPVLAMKLIPYIGVDVEVIRPVITESSFQANVVDERVFCFVEPDKVDDVGNDEVVRPCFVVVARERIFRHI